MSVLNDILDQCVSQVQALGLAIGDVTLPVLKRKAPKREQPLDPVPAITIAKSDRPEETKWLAFPSTSRPGGTVRKRYLVEIVVIGLNGGDMLTNLDVYAELREQIQQCFQGLTTQAPPLPLVPAVRRLDVEQGDFFKKEDLNANYDYQATGVWFTTIESADGTA